jgi:hypothetical protein
VAGKQAGRQIPAVPSRVDTLAIQELSFTDHPTNFSHAEN